MINQDKSADKKSDSTVVSVHRGLNPFEMAGIRTGSGLQPLLVTVGAIFKATLVPQVGGKTPRLISPCQFVIKWHQVDNYMQFFVIIW